MSDFAGLLVAAREKTGKTQAQVATEAGLTASYLSFIENRKKPPPSDDVCQRLAEVLGISAKRLIEVAHLERAPHTVRKRLQSLDHSLKRERRSRKRLLGRLLSPFLFAGPPGYLEGALDQVGISAPRRRRIREALGAVGRHHQDQADEVARILDGLPERDRAALLEALPHLLDEEARRARTEAPPSGAEPSVEPELCYAPPPRDAMPRGPYLLDVTADMESPAELHTGDRILVDPNLSPEPGDLIVVRANQGVRIRRFDRDQHGYKLSEARPSGLTEKLPPEAFTEDRLKAYLRAVGLGTVIEYRRRLRRPGPEASAGAEADDAG